MVDGALNAVRGAANLDGSGNVAPARQNAPMARYVALIRGINVGAHRRIPMAALRELAEALGHESVETYVQSGNILFESGARSEQKLEGGFEKAIADELGHEVRVMVRSAAHLASIIDGNPFAARDPQPKQLHVTFLSATPTAKQLKALEAGDYAPDEVAAAGREIYCYLPNGAGRANLSNAVLERALGVPGTMRNWRTVTTLADMLAG
jgi:uncharacterized protein (DUF1697 family)